MGGVISKGFIAMFDGTFQNGYPIDETTGLPDTHWHICDGTNGTPDLRDRFIVGSGSSYNVGDKGGEAKHTLTLQEAPSHVHGFEDNGRPLCFYGGNNSGLDTSLGFVMQKGQPWNNSPKGSYDMVSVGGNQPHENRPPYYALAFIKKIR